MVINDVTIFQGQCNKFREIGWCFKGEKSGNFRDGGFKMMGKNDDVIYEMPFLSGTSRKLLWWNCWSEFRSQITLCRGQDLVLVKSLALFLRSEIVAL